MRLIDKKQARQSLKVVFVIMCLSLQSFALKITGSDRLEEGLASSFNISFDLPHTQLDTLQYKIFVLTRSGLKMIQQGEVTLNSMSTNISILLDSMKLMDFESDNTLKIEDRLYSRYKGILLISKAHSNDAGLKSIEVLQQTSPRGCDCYPRIVLNVKANPPSFLGLPLVSNGDEIIGQFWDMWEFKTPRNWKWEISAFRKDGLSVVDGGFSIVDLAVADTGSFSKRWLDIAKILDDTTLIKDEGKIFAYIFSSAEYKIENSADTGTAIGGYFVQIDISTHSVIPLYTKRKPIKLSNDVYPFKHGTKFYDLNGRIQTRFLKKN